MLRAFPAYSLLLPPSLLWGETWDHSSLPLQEGWKGQWLWSLQPRNVRPSHLCQQTCFSFMNSSGYSTLSSLPWLLVPAAALGSVRRMFSSMGASIPLWSRSLAVQAVSS